MKEMRAVFSGALVDRSSDVSQILANEHAKEPYLSASNTRRVGVIAYRASQDVFHAGKILTESV